LVVSFSLGVLTEPSSCYQLDILAILNWQESYKKYMNGTETKTIKIIAVNLYKKNTR
jgi:hypothetical protein